MTQVEPLRAGLLCSVRSTGRVPGPVLLGAGLPSALHDQGVLGFQDLPLGVWKLKAKAAGASAWPAPLLTLEGRGQIGTGAARLTPGLGAAVPWLE